MLWLAQKWVNTQHVLRPGIPKTGYSFVRMLVNVREHIFKCIVQIAQNVKRYFFQRSGNDVFFEKI